MNIRGATWPTYHAFVDWDPDATVAGRAAFGSFWNWLQPLRAQCVEASASLMAYCWSAGAENRWLREGATTLAIGAEVEQFVESAAWVDLLRVFQDQVVTGQGGSLKSVAPLTGFAWRDDDPGGAQSMQWWADAVDTNLSASERARHRTRLLQYNEDDVRATRHIRDWLDAHGPQLTSTRPWQAPGSHPARVHRQGNVDDRRPIQRTIWRVE